MAPSEMTVFEQFLKGQARVRQKESAPHLITLQFVEGVGSPASQRWQLLGYDTFGILVEDSRDTYYFPWHAILYVS